MKHLINANPKIMLYKVLDETAPFSFMRLNFASIISIIQAIKSSIVISSLGKSDGLYKSVGLGSWHLN